MVGKFLFGSSSDIIEPFFTLGNGSQCTRAKLIYNICNLLPGNFCIISPWRSAGSSIYSDTASLDLPDQNISFLLGKVWASRTAAAAAAVHDGEVTKLAMHLASRRI